MSTKSKKDSLKEIRRLEELEEKRLEELAELHKEEIEKEDKAIEAEYSKKLADICLACVNKCKQYSIFKIVTCPSFKPKKEQDKKENTLI